MKKLLAIFLSVVMLLAFAAPALADTVATRDLIIDGGPSDGARTDVGGIVVDYTVPDITVTYTIDDPNWEILETHVYIGIEAPNKAAPGKFDYEAGEAVAVTADTVYYIAAHACLGQIDPGTGLPVVYPGTDIQVTETAWAQNETFLSGDDVLIRNKALDRHGSSWATYFPVTSTVTT